MDWQDIHARRHGPHGVGPDWPAPTPNYSREQEEYLEMEIEIVDIDAR